MSDPQHQTDLEELEAIAAELEALGEPLPEDLAQELAQARALERVHSAAQQGVQAIEALPAELPALEEALEGLHRLRGASGEDHLSAPRAEQLWEGLSQRLPQQQPEEDSQVISLRRRVPGWAWASAVAAVAAVLLAVLFWSQPGVQGPGSAGGELAQREVPQVELERAQQRLERVEAESLQALMAQSTPLGTQRGDHGLRRLRQARMEAAQARLHARARRL